MAAWEPALAEHGAVLVEERRAWVAEGSAEFARLCAEIGERRADADRVRVAARGRAGRARARSRDALQRGRELDARRLVTHAGPHRDDLAVTLGARDLRLVGSAGQQRTAAIALRLLEAATFRSARRRAAVAAARRPVRRARPRRARRACSRCSRRARRQGLGQTILCVPREDEIPPRVHATRRGWRDRSDGAFSGHGRAGASGEAA